MWAGKRQTSLNVDVQNASKGNIEEEAKCKSNATKLPASVVKIHVHKVHFMQNKQTEKQKGG